MYQQFFNFSTPPFSIAPDPDFIYMSDQHQEGLAHLLYGINQGGCFVALTGEVGTGKTTLCHCLLNQLPDNVDIALVLNPKLNANDLLASVCDELHISYEKEWPTLKEITDTLNTHLLETHAKGRKTILLIDEAQNLSLEVLEQIRLLTNLETPKTKLLQIILVGQPELKKLLENPELRQLNQRITARYHLVPLSFSETQKYIKHRISISGGNTKIFKNAAVKKVYQFSKGIPRLINTLCDRALLGAYVADSRVVTSNTVIQAGKEVLNSHNISANYKAMRTSSIFILLAGLAFVIYYFVIYQPQQTTITLPTVAKETVIKKPVVKEVVQRFPVEMKKQEDKKVLPLDFNYYVKQQKLSLDTGVSRLALLWGKNIPVNYGCDSLISLGLQCLLSKSSWYRLVALNRPAILELSISETEKKYVLLIGLKNGNPVFQFNSEMNFPIDQVLALWGGYYLMLWQPPVENIMTVYPQQSSEAILWIRKQLAKNQNQYFSRLDSNLFDADLIDEVMTFQERHHLVTDGIVGTKTFIHLQNDDPNDNSTKLKKIN